MTAQRDFRKPKPHDFAALMAGVDMSEVSHEYRCRAREHVEMTLTLGLNWLRLISDHDKYDRAHFERSGISREKDVWDNRRKMVAK